MSSSGFHPALLFLYPIPPALALVLVLVSVLWLSPGGVAWALSGAHRTIPGPPGVVLAFSGALAHRVLARLARSLRATPLMAFSVGLTRFIVSSQPDTAKEILNSSAFADRPIKESAYELLFHRAMGFAPFGEYWRNLRRISATYLFSPRRIAAFGEQRKAIGNQMVKEINALMGTNGEVQVRSVLHFGSLNNVMMSVFGKRFDFGKGEGLELDAMVREGYELLGVFNWSDHLPWLRWMDLQGIRSRCKKLIKRVNEFVGRIIDEHRRRRRRSISVSEEGGVGDFVDVLLDLEEEENLSDSDMIAVLWVFLFSSLFGVLLFWFRIVVLVSSVSMYLHGTYVALELLFRS